MQIGGFQAAFQGIVAFDELQLRLAPICTSGANRYIAKVLRGAACEGLRRPRQSRHPEHTTQLSSEMTKTPSRTLILVRADWDDDAKVWVASSADIDGLATEAATLEELRDKVLVMVAELAELNGLSSDLPEIPVHILAGQTARIPNPNFR
jgi:hypothetical protein